MTGTNISYDVWWRIELPFTHLQGYFLFVWQQCVRCVCRQISRPRLAVKYLWRLGEDLRMIFNTAREKIGRAYARQKGYTDLPTRQRNFRVNDFVQIHLQEYLSSVTTLGALTHTGSSAYSRQPFTTLRRSISQHHQRQSTTTILNCIEVNSR